jgi:hypothetical protein
LHSVATTLIASSEQELASCSLCKHAVSRVRCTPQVRLLLSCLFLSKAELPSLRSELEALHEAACGDEDEWVRVTGAAVGQFTGGKFDCVNKRDKCTPKVRHGCLCVFKCCVSGVRSCSPLAGLCWKCEDVDDEKVTNTLCVQHNTTQHNTQPASSQDCGDRGPTLVYLA